MITPRYPYIVRPSTMYHSSTVYEGQAVKRRPGWFTGPARVGHAGRRREQVVSDQEGTSGEDGGGPGGARGDRSARVSCPARSTRGERRSFRGEGGRSDRGEGGRGESGRDGRGSRSGPGTRPRRARRGPVAVLPVPAPASRPGVPGGSSRAADRRARAEAPGPRGTAAAP